MSDAACKRCGRDDGQHDRTETDCVLPRHNGHAAATVGNCCSWCVDRHKEWLEEIPRLYERLADVVAIGSIAEAPSEHQKPRKKPASPAAMRLDAWAMTAGRNTLYAVTDRYDGIEHDGSYLNGLPDVPAVITSWAATAYESFGWTGTAPKSVEGAAAFLRSQADHIAEQPFIDDYDTELAWLRRSLRRAHGIVDPPPLGTCMTVQPRICGGTVWRQEDGTGQCGKCGRRYAKLALVRLKVHERRVSA